MAKIICLLGKSGSGKSTMEKILAEVLNLKKIVNCTTRPKREQELDGIDYHFISKEKFNEMANSQNIIACRDYRGWFYGINKKSIDLNGDNVYICAIDPNGLKDIQMYFEEKNVIPIYLFTKDRDLIRRMTKREKNPNHKEVIRRFISDIELFEEMERGDDSCITFINNCKWDNAIIKLVKYIKQELKERE